MTDNTRRSDRPEKDDDDAAVDITPGRILVAYEKLFGGGRGVQKFARSGLRYVRLAGGAVLVEQNPNKKSEWAGLAQAGRRVAWVMREGEYLARVVDGEVVMLD
jgi:hypothetical protein